MKHSGTIEMFISAAVLLGIAKCILNFASLMFIGASNTYYPMLIFIDIVCAAARTI